MGFGWMFLGYMFLLRANVEILGFPMDITPDIIGFLLMAKGFSIASKYCGCFRLTKLLGQIGIPFAAAVLLFDLSVSAKLIDPPTWLVTVSAVFYTCFLLIFTLSLLYSLYRISAETGLEKTRKKAARCAIYTVIFFCFEQMGGNLARSFGIPFSDASLSMVETLSGALYVILNATLIFSCYMWICLEGDEDMPDTRKHKYKTPFDYFDDAKAKNQVSNKSSKHKKKRR